MNRTIKHITLTETGTIVAVCEDGTMWSMNLNFREKGWYQIPQIPSVGNV